MAERAKSSRGRDIAHIICLALIAAVFECFFVLALAYFRGRWEDHWYFFALILGTLFNAAILTVDYISYFMRRQLIYRSCLIAYIFLIFVAVIAYALFKTGFAEVIRDEEKFKEYLEQAGSWMTALFITLQFLQVVILPIPSTVTVVAGSALFGPLYGSLYSLIGILIGSIVAFLIGRYAGFRVVAWIVGEETLEKWLKKLTGQKAGETKKPHSHLKTCAILFVCWLPYLAVCYPGTTLYDARTMLEQYFGLSQLTNHHPYFQILLLGTFVEAGHALGSGAAGMFVYVLLQELAFIFVLSYMLKCLEKFGISEKVRKILLWIYALLPVFPVYAISVGKNMNFSIVLVLLTIFLFELIESDETFLHERIKMVFLPVLLILLCLFRNEGFWIVVGCLPAFLWAGRKHWRIFACIFAGVFLFGGLWFRCVLPALHVEDGSIAESLSIPFLQTARTVAYYGDEITEEEKQAIDAVLEYDTLPQRYLPEFSDRVKERYNNDATQEELAAYWKVYVQQFLEHPVTYVDAFLNKCYGYFYPDDLGRTKAWFVVGADISPLNEIGFDLYARFPNAVRKLDGLLEAFRQIPLLGYTSSVGFYTWCTFLSMFFILLSKKKGLLWLFVPAILVILVCVASPVNAYFRYELPVVFSVPYFFAVTVYAMKTGEKEADAGQC